MAEEKKKRIIRVMLMVLGVIVATLIFKKIIDEWTGFKKGISLITSAAAPIISGFIIAFLINPILVFFDRCFHTLFQDRLIKDKKKLHKVSRVLSIILTLIVFLSAIAGVLSLVLPQFYESVRTLVDNMKTYFDNIQAMTDKLYDKFNQLNIFPEEDVKDFIDTAYDKLMEWLNTQVLPNLDKVVFNIGSGVIGGLKFIYNFLIGIIVSIYVMYNKEYLASRSKKTIYAIFKIKNANLFLDGVAVVNQVFSRFINGKILDSIIIALIMFIFTSILQMPYAILISVIIGVTNIIPFFGPIIGAIPCFFIVLIEDPLMSLILLALILLIQQFDGNVLGPKILGEAIGISSFWVLVSVVVGGGLFGFLGMLLGVPVFTCLYMYINRVCTMRLKEKNIISHTREFERIKRIDEKTGEPIYKTEEELDIRFKKKTSEEKQKKHADHESVDNSVDTEEGPLEDSEDEMTVTENIDAQAAEDMDILEMTEMDNDEVQIAATKEDEA